MRRLGLGGTILTVALSACAGGGPTAGDPGTLPSPDTDRDGLADEVELGLLLQYRPVWAFDAGEEIWPISVEEWAAIGGRVADASGGAGIAYADPASLLAAIRARPEGVMVTAEEIRPGVAPCVVGTGCDAAPVYADAVPVPFSYGGRRDLVWLHYWLLYHFDRKALGPGRDLSHYGDWEHVCVLASIRDLGRVEAPPVGLHFHAHGALTVADRATAWHEDPACAAGASAEGCRGRRHPRVYVEANGHATFADAGETGLGPHFGALLNPAEQLDNPLVILTPHAANATSLVDEIVREFRGRWGQTPGRSPFGPFVPTGACDHDWTASPRLEDWLPACRTR